MARNLARSRSGWHSSSAMASTRSLKSSQESSRLMNRVGDAPISGPAAGGSRDVDIVVNPTDGPPLPLLGSAGGEEGRADGPGPVPQLGGNDPHGRPAGDQLAADRLLDPPDEGRPEAVGQPAADHHELQVEGHDD